ncbi:TIL domain-containing protein [Caerostris darwini]|uniref:TIL domain-containing protein n=1 Tax=Caerostris darwini TaxID=1538125 RepID=A0AAV4QPR6_9ARAC|nr:TIL domain-containing protein [Caerostris darwini]
MATPIKNATQEKMIDFAENVTTLLTVARTIESIFAKDNSYHRPTKTAVLHEFLKLDTLFGDKEKIINQLRIEIDSLQQKEKEHNEKIEQLKEKDLQIAMLKGQLQESRNFNREVLTDNLKAITEAINITKQVQTAPTKSFAEAVKKQQTTFILAPKDKDQSVKDMRSNISKQLKKSGELDGVKRVLIDNNQLIIKTKTDEQAQKLHETIEKNTELKEVIMVRTPPEQKAKIICYGIPRSAPCSLHVEGIGSGVSCSSNSGDDVKCMVICNNKFEGVYACRSGNWSPKLPSCAKPSADVANEAPYGEDEVYSPCEGHCEKTCSNWRDGPSCTPEVCVGSYICRQGLVRSPDGKCVPKEECTKSTYPVSGCQGWTPQLFPCARPIEDHADAISNFPPKKCLDYCAKICSMSDLEGRCVGENNDRCECHSY